MVDVDFLFDLPNQSLVERLKFVFIANVKYDKLPLFCSNCKMIGYDLSNCRRLQQDANVISGGEKTIGAKIHQHYCPKVVGAQDGTKASLTQMVVLLKVFMMEPMVEPVVEFVVESVVEFVVHSFMVQPIVVRPIAESQPKPMMTNHDNICVVN